MATTEDPSDTHSPASTLSPSVDINRRKHPCVLCQKRKVKCDRNDPCDNCTKGGVQCISSATLPPKRRKKRFAEAELLARLRRYEDHLRRYGADINAINNESTASVVPDVPRKMGDAQRSPVLEFQPRNDAVRSLAIRRSLKDVKSNFWTPTHKEFKETEDLLQASEDEDETLETPIMKAYDAINSDGSDFFMTPTSDSITDLHPSPVQIFRLWQTFIDNVNPLIKIFHAPSIQQKVLEASADLENVGKGMEALMFAIYSTAIMSLNEEECMSMFGEERQVLLARYQNGSRQALARAGLLRSSDMTILQAFVLYLMSCLNFSIDPRAHFCLTGIAVRIAQRMGLNYDGTIYGLPPFETEMRRRLWFQIMFLDNRVSELSGAGASILNYIWTTKPPLNVNDSDLFPDMKETPTESRRLTEMTYVLQRCEIANLLQAVRSGKLGDSIEEKAHAISDLRLRLSKSYDQYSDPSVPLHLLSKLMMRCALAKMEMGPRSSHGNLNTVTLSSAEKDRLFLLSLEMVESHTAMLGSPSLKRFMWHITTNFPFPAHVFLLIALRQRTVGPMAERAWLAFEDHYEKRMLTSQLTAMSKPGNTPLHAAVANLTFKAWNARERDVPEVEVPRFVKHLKSRLNEKGHLKGEEEVSGIKGSPYPVIEKLPQVKEDVVVPTKMVEHAKTAEEMAPLTNHTIPYMWSNEQAPVQFDLAMGVNFDDEMMMDLTPSFGGEGYDGYFGWDDPWSDFQPDSYGTGVSINGDFNGVVGQIGFGRQF